MAAEKIQLGFEIDRVDDATCFTTRGIGLGCDLWFGVAFCALIAGLFFGAIAGMGDGSFSKWFWIGLIAGLGYGVWLDVQRRRTVSFAVTDTVVDIDGKSYAKADISELLVRNRKQTVVGGQVQHTGSTFVIGTGVTGAAIAGATALGNSARQMGATTGAAMVEGFARRSFELAIRHGSRVIPLARHMKEDTAISLFNEVKRVF